MIVRLPLDMRTAMVIEGAGMAHSHALACVLGVRELPRTVDDFVRIFSMAEWVDILAKLRALRAHDLHRTFPIARQYCGCRMLIEKCPGDGSGAPCPAHSELVNVLLCSGHWIGSYADTGCDQSGRVTIGHLAENPTIDEIGKIPPLR